jgi:two-component system, OmpR family, response regulator MtrA
MATVLLVEDDPGARQGLELALRRLGYGVHAAETGEAALRDFRDAAADVVVLDVMLPGLDGFEVCRRLRRAGDIPVIMLTARGDDLDIVSGLEAGADDYVVKPVEPRVLDARIRAVIRRTARAGSPAETYGELMIDRGSLIVRRAGQAVSLTPTELVWEHDYLGDSRLVDACVQRAGPRPRAGPGRDPACVRPVLQGRHGAGPFCRERPGPGDRLGECVPPRRSHPRGQPPGRRRGIHREPPAEPGFTPASAGFQMISQRWPSGSWK